MSSYATLLTSSPEHTWDDDRMMAQELFGMGGLDRDGHIGW